MVTLPGTLCSPAVFGPLGEALADEVRIDPYSWLTELGPWDIPAVSERVARHIDQRYGGPVLVCGHSTGGAIALHLAATRPETVRGLVLADTGAHMRGHGDVDAILARIRDAWGAEFRAAVLPNAEFRLLDTGHTPVYEDPASVADAVRTLLEREAHR
jgi:pimeloyl-ACP methyl ester carboxylesterase